MTTTDTTIGINGMAHVLSREPGRRAKLIPQDWMTDIPEKTDPFSWGGMSNPAAGGPVWRGFFRIISLALSTK